MRLHVQYRTPDLNRFLRSTEALVARTNYGAKKGVPRLLAIDFVPFIINVIKTNKYIYVWDSRALRYNVRYKEWKMKYFSHLGFWILRGQLLKAITHFKMGDGYMAGIPQGKMDTGGTSWFGAGDKGPPKPIAMYARVLEYGGDFRAQGGGFHPPRPLFHPALVHYRLGDAKKIGRKYLRDTISRAWK